MLYASIDHGNISPNRPVRDNVEDNDCDYAVVNLPKITTDTAKHKITEDSSDDYVLMGWALMLLWMKSAHSAGMDTWDTQAQL